MNKRHKSELRAGLFVNLGAALLMLALFFFGSRLKFFWKPIHYAFFLDNAQGLISGSKVYMAGIDAGKVDHVSLDREKNLVRVDFDLSPEYQESVRQESYVELSTQGVLGDKVVLVFPGNPKKPEIPPGEDIPIKSSSSLNQLVARGDTLVHDLDHLILNLDHFSTKLNTDLSFKKATDALSKIDSILGKLDDGQGTLGAFINDPGLYDDAKALVGEANNNRILRNVVRQSVEEAKNTKNKG